MKISTIVAGFTLFLHIPAIVEADRLVRFLFNDGKDEPDSGECDTWDSILIDGIFTISGHNFTYARQLRSSNHASRGLQYFPPKCKKNCEGITPKHCKATDCVGYRRSLFESTDSQRDLGSGKSFSCATQVDFINTELDKLVNSSLVSSSCKTLLSKHRKVDCYDDVIFGVVERIALWHANPTPTIANSTYTGQSICKNTRVDFEPITNTCVDNLFSTVTGPNDFYKNSTRSDYNISSATKTVFGSANVEDSGIVFPYLGAYTIKSVPDGFQNKALTIPFNVVTGAVESVRLWNTTTNTIVNSNVTDGNICRYRRFALEIVLGSCATSVKAVVTGPGGTRIFTDTNRPFSLFGESSGNFVGRYVTTLGTYNLTIYPDQIESAEAKSILFNVVDCA